MNLTYNIKAIKRKVNIKEVTVYSVASFIINIAFAVMLYLKNYAAFDIYMSCLIPLISFNIGTYIYCSYRASNMSLQFAMSSLNTIGFALMCIISPEGLVVKHLVGMISSIFVFVSMRLIIIKINPTMLSILLLASTIGLYLVLLIQPAQNGAKAWLIIGGLSLQLTELIKILFILNMALLYSSKSLSNSAKLIFLVGHLVVHAFFSLVISELGSLMILLITGYLVQLLFGGKRQTIILTLVALVTALSTIFLIITLNGNTNEALQNIIDRLIGRFTNADPYQINQAQKAFVSGGFFGTTEHIIPVPVATSDFAFTSLAQHLGLVIASIAILFFISLLYLLSREVNLSSLSAESLAAIITVIIITTQSAYIILANIGALPISGINCYFITDSGTGILLSYLFGPIVISGLAKGREDLDDRTKRRN